MGVRSRVGSVFDRAVGNLLASGSAKAFRALFLAARASQRQVIQWTGAAVWWRLDMTRRPRRRRARGSYPSDFPSTSPAHTAPIGLCAGTHVAGVECTGLCKNNNDFDARAGGGARIYG